jgi:long-chain fatty acid transport protein
MRKVRSLHRRAVVTASAASLVLTSLAGEARAAGLYFSDRGTRPMGRAGAFVAGADDLGAIWYNPAGLADAGTSLLVDFGWLNFSDTFSRQLQIATAQGTLQTVTSPTVNGNAPIIPVPTMAASLALDSEHRFTVAGGFFAPQVALASYPDTVAGQPSPSRYSLGSFNGSALGYIGTWVAWKPFDEIRIGVGIQALVGQFETTVTFSACPPDRLLCAPEQPDFDAHSQLKVGPIIAPTANAGVTLVPSKYLRIGISGQLPTYVSSHAQIQVQLPSNAIFDTAHVSGSDAHVSFALPAIFRVGVELRPIRRLRVEATFVREFWSVEHSINAVPEGISIDGITGLPPAVNLPPIDFPRNFQSSNSYSLGGEYTFDVAGYPIDARMGVSYEQSAVPVSYVSLLSLDMSKVTVTLGGGIHVGRHWRFDALYGHIFASSVYVAPNVAQITRIDPLSGNAPFDPVNGGTYTAKADLLGVGFNYLF